MDDQFHTPETEFLETNYKNMNEDLLPFNYKFIINPKQMLYFLIGKLEK